jgi:hypothetical protein
METQEADRAGSPVPRWSGPLQKTSRALLEWACHLLLVSAILTGIWLIERLLGLLWTGGPPVLFGLVPIKFIFDGADLGILCALLFYGVYTVVRSYTQWPN